MASRSDINHHLLNHLDFNSPKVKPSIHFLPSRSDINHHLLNHLDFNSPKVKPSIHFLPSKEPALQDYFTPRNILASSTFPNYLVTHSNPYDDTSLLGVVFHSILLNPMDPDFYGLIWDVHMNKVECSLCAFKEVDPFIYPATRSKHYGSCLSRDRFTCFADM
jgi:hypothetical protein